MRVHFLRKNNTQSLYFFALGWGCDYTVLEHLVTQIPDNHDIVCTYDYKTVKNAEIICANYKSVTLLAWSFGVWAAEMMFSPKMEFKKAIALCATPMPISDEYGIAKKRINATIKGFKLSGTEQFNKAVYPSSITPPALREVGETIEELEILTANSQQEFTPHIKWDKAIIAEKDSIFPAKNLLTYWASRAIVLPLPHYPFEHFQLITRELGI